MAKVYLIGFMGSGKSTIGRRLSAATDVPLIDMDKYIEDMAGMTVPEIFASQGESQFRELERNALNEIITSDGDAIISTGGGVPCYGDNMDAMLASGTVIYIKMTPRALIARLRNSKDERPLLKGKTDDELLEYIESMLAVREPYYCRASVITDGISVKPSRLIKYVKKHN